jgi:hypothetical protein
MMTFSLGVMPGGTISGGTKEVGHLMQTLRFGFFMACDSQQELWLAIRR